MVVVYDNLHLEALGPISHNTADPAIANDPQGFVKDLSAL